jgi:thiazole synthase
MARAFRLAVEGGRAGFRAGLAGAGRIAAASSPLTGFLDEASPVGGRAG